MNTTGPPHPHPSRGHWLKSASCPSLPLQPCCPRPDALASVSLRGASAQTALDLQALRLASVFLFPHFPSWLLLGFPLPLGRNLFGCFIWGSSGPSAEKPVPTTCSPRASPGSPWPGQLPKSPPTQATARSPPRRCPPGVCFQLWINSRLSWSSVNVTQLNACTLPTSLAERCGP